GFVFDSACVGRLAPGGATVSVAGARSEVVDTCGDLDIGADGTANHGAYVGQDAVVRPPAATAGFTVLVHVVVGGSLHASPTDADIGDTQLKCGRAHLGRRRRRRVVYDDGDVVVLGAPTAAAVLIAGPHTVVVVAGHIARARDLGGLAVAEQGLPITVV